jgi:hypothetical protein
MMKSAENRFAADSIEFSATMSQRPDPERPNRLVELACEDTVAIVNQEFVPVVVPDDLTQLLQRPGGAWTSRDVVVDQSAAAMLNDGMPTLLC